MGDLFPRGLGPRVLFKVLPRFDESLAGFLTRIGEANFLRSAHGILWKIGKSTFPLSDQDLIALAEFCSCDVGELAELFGGRIRRIDGLRAWKLGEEWIGKDYFIATRNQPCCPNCLKEDGYLKAAWELTFYTCCGRHGVELIEQCPQCGWRLTWQRGKVTHCRCGYDLRESPISNASPFERLVAQLVDLRITGKHIHALMEILPPHVMGKLSVLSMDGLFRTIWFFGYCLSLQANGKAGPLDNRFKSSDAKKILDSAFNYLVDWPTTFIDTLNKLGNRPHQRNTTILAARTFGPIHRFLSEEAEQGELIFLWHAYERFLRDFWKVSGRHRLPSPLSPQTEFDFWR